MTLLSGTVTRTAHPNGANIRQHPAQEAPDVGDLHKGDSVQFDPTPIVGGKYRVGGVWRNTWYRLANGYVAEHVVSIAPENAPEPDPDVQPQPLLDGIDVSQAQASIDWLRLRQTRIGFVIVRATQGVKTSIPVGVDTRFHEHIDGALQAGLQVGVYHNHLPEVDGAKQAVFFYETIAPYLDKLAFPPAVDVETVNGRTRARITSSLYALVTTLDALLGQKPMIYTAPGFWDDYILPLHDAYFAQCALWCAHWGVSKPTLPRAWRNAGKDWLVWQTSNQGRVAGYAGRIDLNKRRAP